MVCRFVEVTQIIPIYGFGRFFLKKIVLEKNHVIRLYEVTKIKESGENHYSPNKNL